MFCPKCGKSDQLPDSYCRQCGIFLPDLLKPIKTGHPPEEHVTVNIVLTSMTILVAFTLAILLWSILGFRETSHPLIYATAGLLFAMGIWHIQTLWRTLMLRKYLKKNKRPSEIEIGTRAVSNDKLLEKPDFEHMVPASVTELTTNHLAETKLKSS